MAWERARTDEQKEVRVAEIVEATARLYDTYRFEDITLSLIAKEAKFTRSNLYKYFSSKEEIFLECFKRDIALACRDLEAAYERDRTYTIREFAEVWVRTFVRHPRFLRLHSILSTILERNVSVESLVDFKRSLNSTFTILSGTMCAALPTCTPGQAAEFLSLQSTMAGGLYAATNLSGVQRQVLDMPEFEHYHMDFTIAFQDAVEYLLQGMLGSRP